MFLQKRFAKSSPPSYQQITFGSGTIRSARFAPDGQTIIYSVSWDGNPLKLFLKHPSSPDSLPLELPSANLLGISPTGEMAIAIDCRSNHPGVCAGTLARAALTGGSPRDVAEHIQEADWAADGATLLIVRDVGGKSRIEYPPGKVLYETSGHVSYARLSPKGDRIAFLDHPFALDDAGTVAAIDLAGKKTTLTGKWASEHGLAWSPSGDEVWFTATEAGANRSLYAVTLSGKLRVVTRVPGGLKLHDIAKGGHVLLTRESPRVGILGVLAGDTRERDMSGPARYFSASGPTAASVATMPSIVAMLGWIIPAPLEMPVTVTVRPSITDLARYGLGHRVRRHDRLGRRGPVVRRQVGNASRQAGRDSIDGQGLHDHAG